MIAVVTSLICELRELTVSFSEVKIWRMPHRQWHGVWYRRHDNRADTLMKQLRPRRRRQRRRTASSSISFHNPHMWPPTPPSRTAVSNDERQEARSCWLQRLIWACWWQQIRWWQSSSNSKQRDWVAFTAGVDENEEPSSSVAGRAQCNYRRSTGACPDRQHQSFLLLLLLLSHHRIFCLFLSTSSKTDSTGNYGRSSMYRRNVFVFSSYLPLPSVSKCPTTRLWCRVFNTINQRVFMQDCLSRMRILVPASSSAIDFDPETIEL